MPSITLSLDNCLHICDSMDREIVRRIIELSYDDGECRVWAGSTNKHNYPVMHYVYAGTINVVPFIYRTFVDPHHESKNRLRRICEKRLCVSPNHIELTHKGKERLLLAEAFREKWRKRQRDTGRFIEEFMRAESDPNYLPEYDQPRSDISRRYGY